MLMIHFRRQMQGNQIGIDETETEQMYLDMFDN